MVFVLLFFTMSFSLSSVRAEVNYSGGVLDGKGAHLHRGNYVGEVLTPDFNMTDNDTSTSTILTPQNIPTNLKNAYVDLGKKYTITHYIQHSDSGLIITFSYEDKSINRIQPTIKPISQKTELPNRFENVRYINWGNNNYSNNAVYEINFFGIAEPDQLTAVGGESVVNLTWNTDASSESYSIKRSISPGGPYEEVGTSVNGSYLDANVQNGVAYYYIVTALNQHGESAPSNEANAIPYAPVVDPGQPLGNNAIVVITMTNGLEKEYDLSMQEVNSFIEWYETKQVGSGQAAYAINKHDNNKGPFKSRKDYILFDRILTFEVSEY